MTPEDMAMVILDELGRSHYLPRGGQVYACQEPEYFSQQGFYDPLCRGCTLAFKAIVVNELAPPDEPCKLSLWERPDPIDHVTTFTELAEAFEIVSRYTNVAPLPLRERAAI